MNNNDLELDKRYSNHFEVTYFSKDTIPKSYLPYGLIYDSEKYLNKEENEINLDEWTVEIYEDSLKYLRNENSNSKSEWNKDFIVCTNLQVSFYNNPSLIKNTEDFELITDFVCKHVRSLRSSLARNVHLLIECFCHTISDNEMFKSFCIKVIPHLLASTGSEKSVYSEPSRNNLKILTNRCSKNLDQEIFFLLLENTSNLNKKISSSAGDCSHEFFTNINEDDYKVLDIPKLSGYLEKGLNGNNVQVKKTFKEILTKLHKHFITLNV